MFINVHKNGHFNKSVHLIYRYENIHSFSLGWCQASFLPYIFPLANILDSYSLEMSMPGNLYPIAHLWCFLWH